VLYDAVAHRIGIRLILAFGDRGAELGKLGDMYRCATLEELRQKRGELNLIPRR
jgi:hypothetical protein